MTTSRTSPAITRLSELLRRVPRADMAVLGTTAPVAAVLAHTDERARALEAEQLLLGRGPSVEVAASQRAVLADLHEIRTYWTDFARRARELRLHSLLIVPLEPAFPSGALSLYAHRSRAFDEADEDVVRRNLHALARR
ncbi:GAF domain-containing protein [Saccharopolyspora rhizosphaerae]|uniref:GAF domain-containing protein n=1 Tax=Saccharopolyspora rhizosphaerae TaxID=2492662 RepID=A0A426JM04_9PSEU|nr:GAF domain-containing protein [Saccharopolyspora rhizosphaerae]RRO14191.1 GAF domain-containing protein [Saccharopolyspora rhizosphaerae]